MLDEVIAGEQLSFLLDSGSGVTSVSENLVQIFKRRTRESNYPGFL